MRLYQNVELFSLLFDNGFYSTKIDNFNTKKNLQYGWTADKKRFFMHEKEEEKIISFLQQFLNHHLE